MNRVRAGFCTVPNPFNSRQVTRVSLRPEDVDAIVFWTRNPAPMLSYLPELDACGFRYYFQITLMGNPRFLDPKTPTADKGVEAFRRLAEKIGPERVIWRYDPVVLTDRTDHGFHARTFARLAERLSGCTQRAVFSFVDYYRKAVRRLKLLEKEGIVFLPQDESLCGRLLEEMASAAAGHGIRLKACNAARDLAGYGIEPGSCIDPEILRDVLGVSVPPGRDGNQRANCGCAPSKDIGMYESCLFGCRYCYATGSFERAGANFRAHDPQSPSLLGWHEQKAPACMQGSLLDTSKQG